MKVGKLESHKVEKLEMIPNLPFRSHQSTNPLIHQSITLFFLLLLLSASSISQSFTNSPYSRFAVGELQYGGFAHNIGMGGLYNALQNDSTAPFHINTANPASHASMRLTVFDFGIKSNSVRMETTDKAYSSNQTELSHMALAFPVAKWWGASFGLLPYSSVGYKIHDEREQDSIGTVKYSYQGEGGINQLYFGNGFKIRDLSLGVNVAYLFGDMVFSSRDSFPKTSNFFNTKFTQSSRISDAYFTFGAQYRIPMKKGWSLTAGLTSSLESNLNIKRTTFAATYVNNFGVEVTKDTIIDDEEIKDTLTIPMSLGAGLVLRKGDRWLFGVDYSMQDWSSFRSPGQQFSLKNSQRLSVGIQYIPNKNAGTKESYLKKVFYRAGFRYTDSYLDLRQTSLTDMAVTFGAGFPLRKIKVGETYSQSLINVGIEMGKMGTVENNLIREKYIKAIVGFSLNDKWFSKRKYD